MNSICIITTLFEYHKQRHGYTTTTLFQSASSTSNPNVESNYASQLNQTTTIPNFEMADVNIGKCQTEGETSQHSKKSTPNNTKGIPIQHPSLQDLWLGFQYMEMLAIDLNVEPYVHTLEACMQVGIPHEEEKELTTATIAFPRVPQKLWPFMHNDNIPRQQYHLTQIPFDVVLDNLTGYALTYQILLHFEKTLQAYTSKEVVDMVLERCEKMGITLGDILEPIAPLCSPKEGKPWNGIVKIHLKNPSLDGGALFTGKKIFALHLDGSLKIPKIAKSFDSTAPKNLLAVKIRSENIKMIPIHQLLAEVVYTSFYRG